MKDPKEFLMTLSNIPAPNTYVKQVELVRHSSRQHVDEVLDKNSVHRSPCPSARVRLTPEKMLVAPNVQINDARLLEVTNQNNSSEEEEDAVFEM